VSALAGRLGALRRSRPARRRRRPALPAAVGRVATPATGVTCGVGFVLAALAFYAQGGVANEPNTYAEVLLVGGGGLLAATALAGPGRHARIAPMHGGWSLGLFGVLALLTAFSIVWSVDPSASWLETNRTFAYLAAFGSGIALVRLLPSHWPSLLSGVALASVIVCAYALVTKVFPEWLAEDEIFARLRAPFGYWNAVGLMAASGVPPLVWLAARRSGHAAANALAYPGLGIVLVCLLLAYSRGALLALFIAMVFWFAVVPLRLRGAFALIVSTVGAGAVVAWAFAQDGLTEDRLDTAVRADAGHELGILLLLMVVVLLAAGLAIGFVTAMRAPSTRTRRIAGRAVLGTIALAVAAGLIGLAGAPGGIDGQVSKQWKQLTDVNARTPANTPDRLTATASVRARYWDEALKVHARSKAVGVGADGYGLARKRFRTSDLDVQHAHGYVVQTLADMGYVGLGVSLAATLAWLLAASAAIGLRRRDRGLPWDAERVGLATLVTVVLLFGVHSFVDWTWFVPANAVLALLCAGWVVGRGPLRRRLAVEGPTGVVAAAEHAGVLVPRPRWTIRERLLRWNPEPFRTASAVGVLLLAGAVMWTTVQPVRAQHAEDAAAVRIQEGAPMPAIDIAQRATRRNPLSPEPWWELAVARAAAGDTRGSEKALEEAVKVQPASAEAWRRLGRFRLSALGEPRAALPAFRAALYLDPQSPYTQSDVLEALQAVAASTTATTP
jgi:O-Antigen ligase/Tetratricopeptide repeat